MARAAAAGPSASRDDAPERVVSVRGAIARWTAARPLRLSMAILVTLAAGSGFVASLALLAAGVGAMWLRYPLAALAAYGVFLLGLRFWVGRLQAQWRGDAPRGWHVDPLDLVPTPDLPSDTGAAAADAFAFDGGEFGGGGAGGRFDLPGDVAAEAHAPDAVPSVASQGGRVGGRLLEALGLDDAVPLVLAAALAGAVVVTSVYLVWVAPVLVGELVLDGVVAGVAYRQTRRLAESSWLHGSVRRTWVAATALVVSLALVGTAATWVRPDADSIGDLFRDAPTQGG
jgi:hypothetical protein